MMTPTQLLKKWFEASLPADALTWLSDAAEKLRKGGDTELYRSISLVTRKIGKADLALTAAGLKHADAAREGWNPSDWSLDQAARIYLLLMSGTDGATFLRRLDQLCNTADVGELVAFYRGLPLYPDQSRYVLRAAEGIRTNMKAVFEAVAHRNPHRQHIESDRRTGPARQSCPGTNAVRLCARALGGGAAHQP